MVGVCLYAAALKREAVGGYSVSVPMPLGHHAEGKSSSEARFMAEDAIPWLVEAHAAYTAAQRWKTS